MSDDAPRARRSDGGLPPSLRWLLQHMIIGVAIGWTALAAILLRDVGGVGTLVRESPVGPIALVMLAIFFAITFGSAGMGFAVMLQPRERKDDGD